MKAINVFTLCTILLITLTGCRRNPNTIWEDTQSAKRHMGRGVKALGGKHGDSRQVRNRNEFMAADDGITTYNPASNETIQYAPMTDYQNPDEIAMGDMTMQQPREMPGEPGSTIPGIESFQEPSSRSDWARTFRSIHFPYNSNLIKGQDNLEIIKNVASYMRQTPHTYIFVEGHCDERGPELYNLALGSHRSNSVRNILIQEGVSPDNIFTISYGKERPLAMGHDEESWQQNRRADFKVYQR